MYPEHIVKPFKEELTTKGFSELTSEAQVDDALSQKGTTLVVVNSVCGCAAGACRPGVLDAIANTPNAPDHLTTVFAGVDREAVAKARSYFLPYPPSSPAIALMKDGDLVHFVQRHHIEGRNAAMISQHLQEVFAEFCLKENSPA